MKVKMLAEVAKAAHERDSLVEQAVTRIMDANADAVQLVTDGYPAPTTFDHTHTVPEPWEAWMDDHTVSRSVDDNVLIVQDGMLRFTAIDPVWLASTSDHYIDAYFVEVSAKLGEPGLPTVKYNKSAVWSGVYEDFEGFFFCAAFDVEDGVVLPILPGMWGVVAYDGGTCMPCYNHKDMLVCPVEMVVKRWDWCPDPMYRLLNRWSKLWDDNGAPKGIWMDILTGTEVDPADIPEMTVTNTTLFDYITGKDVRDATPAEWCMAALDDNWQIADRYDVISTRYVR